MQLNDPHTRPLIELFANLPDSTLKELMEKGYLKWKFADLDAARQKVYRDALQLNLDMAKKQGGEPPAAMSLEALQKGDVGFAVVDIPETGQKVVSWYILFPELPQPMWVTVVGAKAAGTQPYFAAHNQQLPALRKKPPSKPPAEKTGQAERPGIGSATAQHMRPDRLTESSPRNAPVRVPRLCQPWEDSTADTAVAHAGVTLPLLDSVFRRQRPEPDVPERHRSVIALQHDGPRPAFLNPFQTGG
jgi:hypothetical protein